LGTIFDDCKFTLHDMNSENNGLSGRKAYNNTILPNDNMIPNGRGFNNGVGTNMNVVTNLHRIVIEIPAIRLVWWPDSA